MARFSLLDPLAGDPWRALDQLRSELDALAGGRAAGGGAVSGVFPPVNLYESEDAYVLTAELPGVPSKDVEVSLEGRTVTLRGERRIDSRPEAALHRNERQAGTFRRAFELPVEVDVDGVEAVHRNGVLTLRLPKAPEHQARQIKVRSA